MSSIETASQMIGKIDKIVCLGKNYLEHAKELGDAIPEKPVIFLKPASVMKIAQDSSPELKLALPRGMGEVHFECEIVQQLEELADVCDGLGRT